jgi:phosphatidylcholine synthase
MSSEKPQDQTEDGGRLLAWGVHLLTAAGAALALLALVAVFRDAFREALLWLLAALALDGIDGTLARKAKVKERLPRIDGEALDLVIDYLTYVVIPALIIWRAGALPEALALPLMAAVMMSSLYVFARRDMKTADGYFRGFPALWNVVAFYFVVAPPAPAGAAAIVAVLVVLTFAPVHVPHPFRVRDYGAWLPALALLWAGTTLALLLPGLADGAARTALAVSLGSAAAIAGLGLVRTVRGARAGAEVSRPAARY